MDRILEKVIQVTNGVPHTTKDNGILLHKIITDKKYRSCLELGFAHGVGSAYIAGALASNRQGMLTCVDNLSAKERKPNIEDLLGLCDLQKFVNPIYAPSGYNWYLKQVLESSDIEFDFCFIDGSHTWDVDGFAFFIVASLLTKGGLIIFDDLDWSYATSPSLSKTEAVLNMSEERRTTFQIRKVFELLVKRDKRFKCWEENGWGYALKVE